jgi:hypothetical protein
MVIARRAFVIVSLSNDPEPVEGPHNGFAYAQPCFDTLSMTNDGHRAPRICHRELVERPRALYIGFRQLPREEAAGTFGAVTPE